MALTIHMMTAALGTGDAIGNYILSLVQILKSWGCTVQLYADHPNDHFPVPNRSSTLYQPTGSDLLWMHYSIYSDNLHWLRDSSDFTVLDSHGVCPAYLFHGYDAWMEQLCEQGEALLATFVDDVDQAICHTEFVRADLLRRGYRNIAQLPLVVDTQRFTGAGSSIWEPLLRDLDYVLFVGRIVPQKDLKLALRVFAALHARRPQIQFFLVGVQYLPTYAAELEALASELSIADAVVFTGPVVEPDVLTSFYRHARFYLCLSAWESFCVPLVESLYFSTPVLGNALPPIPETMGPGGVILEGTPEVMAGQIDALWDDEGRYEQLQSLGRQHADRFTDARLRAELLKLFARIGTGS